MAQEIAAPEIVNASLPRQRDGKRKLYVGNVPQDITEDQVRAIFTPYGELYVACMIAIANPAHL